MSSYPSGPPPLQVAADLVRVGLEEEAVHGGDVTGPLVVGEVLDFVDEPQKNGKTIRWCQVDVGDFGVVLPSGGPGEGFGPRGIVCGAGNFIVGDKVVVSLPGAVLPGGFAIAARKTYGHVSDGMICSAKELGLGDDHAGIIRLVEWGMGDVPVGTDAIELLGLAEEAVEVNVTPDRGYALSLRGIAREYRHATGAAFTDPALVDVPAPTADGFEVWLLDEAPVRGVAGCDRYVARVVRGVDAGATSPRWMQRRLEQAGMRPISLAVDVTNYVMLELGQPLHAFDLDQADRADRGPPGSAAGAVDHAGRRRPGPRPGRPADHRQRPQPAGRPGAGPGRGDGRGQQRGLGPDHQPADRVCALRRGDRGPHLAPAQAVHRGQPTVRAGRRHRTGRPWPPSSPSDCWSSTAAVSPVRSPTPVSRFPARRFGCPGTCRTGSPAASGPASR